MGYFDIHNKHMMRYMGAKSKRDYKLMLQSQSEDYIAIASLTCAITALAEWAFS